MTRAAFRPSFKSVSSSRWLSAILAAVAVMATVLFGASTWSDYRATLEQGWVQAEDTAHVLEEQINRALDTSRLVTDRVIDIVRFQGFDHFRGPGWADLTAFADAAPPIGSVWVLDEQANLVANSMVPNPPSANFADREYYVPLRDGAPVHITGLLFGRISNVWFFSYNRAIVLDGRFRGIAQTSMHADYFRQFYKGLKLGPGATISVFRRDGALVMRWPLRESDLGASAAETPLFREHVPQQPAGRFETAGADGVRLLMAYRVLADQPLVVTAAISRDHVLAPFWGRFHRNAALFALAALLIAALARAATLAARREREAAAAERLSRQELERQSAMLEAQRRDLAAALAERERLVGSLCESEERLRLAQEAGGLGLWDWNIASDRVVWIGDAYRSWGIDEGELQPSSAGFYRTVHPGDRLRLQAEVEAALRGEGVYDAEFRVIARDGTVRWLAGRGEVIRNQHGEPIRMIGSTIDVTERRQAAEILAQANIDLERRVEAEVRAREAAQAQLFQVQKMETIGQITGGIAHDFNNLLAAMLSNLELLHKRLARAGDTAALKLLDGAVQGAERGAALTQRLLAFARRQDLRPDNVDIAALVGGMEDLLRRSVGPAIQIGTEFADDLWPACVDANQLEMALLNLAVNARDAMPLGGTLTVSGRNETVAGAGHPAGLAPGAYVRLAVADTGTGMDEATLARAIEPFFTTKGNGKGTGLGLSMVHGMAAQSGGALRLSSRPGAGTSAELWLPRAEGGAATDAAARLPEADPAAARPCTVLLVDDDALVAMGTEAVLQDLGHTVVMVPSGARALEVLRSGRRIDLVITDQAMPGMTGVELAAEVRAGWPGLPILLATGYAELPGGADPGLPRLSKPYRQEELAARIAALVGAAPDEDGKVVPLRTRPS